ncbi:lipopolysaccharide biosynthesis protein [Inquilinus sp.]|uniref:lipopolysaccharide biosynthesis protein n=1 Tax=Inquilinus sp. TaxID=1932117 RepID=UPI0037836505
MAFTMNLARMRAVGGQAALFLLAFLLGKGSAFFGPLLLSQIMSIQDYGTAELGLSVGVVGAQILSLGIPGAIPQLVLIRKEGHVLDLLFFVTASIGLIGLGAAAIVYAASGQLLYVFAGIAVAGAGAQVAASVYYRSMGRRFGILVADNLALYVFMIVGGLVFVALGRVPLWAIILGCGAVAAGFTLFALAGLARTIRPRFLAAHVDARKMGFFMMVNSLVYFAIVSSSRILVGWFLSVEAVSVYSVCLRVAGAIFLVHQLITTVYFKKLYEAPADWFDRYYLKLLAITMAGAAVILAGFELFGDRLLPGWTAYFPEMSRVLPIVCMQTIWWVSLAQVEMRINRALISRQATMWLLVCAALMLAAMAALHALALLTLPVAALVFACTLFVALHAQLALLWRHGVRLPRMRIALFVPLVFLIPAWLLN